MTHLDKHDTSLSCSFLNTTIKLSPVNPENISQHKRLHARCRQVGADREEEREGDRETLMTPVLYVQFFVEFDDVREVVAQFLHSDAVW